MLNRLDEIEDGSGRFALESDNNLLHILLGCHIEGLSTDQLFDVWEISGVAIRNMY